MNRPLYWGACILIQLLIVGGAFLFCSQHQEPQQLKQDAAEADKLLEEKNKPEVVVDAQRQPPPDASPHGHWHGDEWHDEPHTPVAQDVPDKQTYTGPLTFHKELLETNPVKALRLQAEERGHWSAKWIPPFPPDDKEASELAYVVYSLIYHKHEYPEISIEREKTLKHLSNLQKEYEKRYPIESDDIHIRARNFDLTKLVWALTVYRILDDDQIINIPSQFTQ